MNHQTIPNHEDHAIAPEASEPDATHVPNLPPASPPPRRPRVKRLLLVLAIAVPAMLLGAWLATPIGNAAGGVAGGVREWFVADATRSDSASSTAGSDGEVQLYQSGMHPWIVTTQPGNCPICGMKLEPIDPAKLTGELHIDPRVVQNIGVRTAEVTAGPLTHTLRTVGSVAYDETRVRTIQTKIDGWIEALLVASEGAQVDVGDPLFSVYSPKLFAAQEEYLSAYANRGGPSGEMLLDAARTRLSYFDLSGEQIAELERRGEPLKAVVVESPYAGVVTRKHANEGMRIEPGMSVYTLADLTRVWVLATVYEAQLPSLEEGARATMTLSYLPGRTFEGRVEYVYPYLADRGREVKVRLEFDNPDGILKPGMFAEVRIDTRADEEATLVERSAVIDTGERRVAFVSKGEGRFEPRNLELGVEADDGRVQVLSGLEPGERVVTSGQFLLDSESRLRESLAKMAGASSGTGPPDAAATQPTTQPEAADEAPEWTVAELRRLLEGQTHCPVTGLKLGAMGEPVAAEYRGQTVKFCCAACAPRFAADPATYLAKLREAQR